MRNNKIKNNLYVLLRNYLTKLCEFKMKMILKKVFNYF